MLKLYKITTDNKYYWQTWDNGSSHTIHWGVIGSEGEVKTIYNSLKEKAKDMIQQEIYGLMKEGYIEIKPEEHIALWIEYNTENMDTEKDTVKMHKIEEIIDEALLWTGLGLCEGGSIDMGTMKICCYVVDFKVAKKAIDYVLKNNGFSDYSRIYNENAEEYDNIIEGLPPQIQIPIDNFDIDALESLRDTDLSYFVDDLSRYFYASENWEVKNSIVHLTQDLAENEVIKELLEESLVSPDNYTKITAIAHLTGDMDLYDRVMSKGEIDIKKLNTEISTYMRDNGTKIERHGIKNIIGRFFNFH